jgi:thioredoxin-related protein
MKQLISATLILILLNTQAQDAEGSLVKWLSLQEAMQKQLQQPRPMIIDFYTSWCGWCKHMMRTTYANPGLAEYINTNLYPVKFDAEGKDSLVYLGVTYKPVSDAPRITHPLAAKLLGNKLMYPSTLFLNGYDKTKNEFQYSMMGQGYLDQKKIEPMLVFMLENVYRNSTFDAFNEQFNTAFNDSANEARLKKIVWESAPQFFNGKNTSGKKTLVFINTDWCNACKVMYRSSFTDSLNLLFLQEKFNLINFDPQITDSLSFKDMKFGNARSQQMPFHQLAVALCRNSFTLPTLAVLDEKQNVLDAIPYFLNAQVLHDITTYYGTNTHLQKSWTDFMKDRVK